MVVEVEVTRLCTEFRVGEARISGHEDAKRKRPNFNFKEMGIEPAAELRFRDNTTVTVEVADERRVQMADENLSMTEATKRARKVDHAVAPLPYWRTPDGRLLSDIYNDLPEFVGIIGEMQAFRVLKDEFGINESAWVSEFRSRVVPPLDGEKDQTSDSHGYDFRFEHEGKTWCVEVKATTGDGTSFELPSSELNAASRIAPSRDQLWRILRVRQALSKRPECDWLPNPFEPGARERLRVLQSGVTVEYERSEDKGTAVQREADERAHVEVAGPAHDG